MSSTTTATSTTLKPISGAALGGVRRSNRYTSLIEIGYTADKALAACGYRVATPATAKQTPVQTTPVTAQVAAKDDLRDPRVTILLDAGYELDEALAHVAEYDAEQGEDKAAKKARKAEKKARKAAKLAEASVTLDKPDAPITTPAKVTPAKPATPASSADKGEALVAERGLGYAKGRVYVTTDMLEAAVRVRKTGSPEIIGSAAVGRTSNVLLFRTDNGQVAFQNLRTIEEN